MCSIVGIVPTNETPKQPIALTHKFRQLMLKGRTRGRDSWGYAMFQRYNFIQCNQGIDVPRIVGKDCAFQSGTIAAIGNLRAEPTTEIAEDRLGDYQPHYCGRWCVVHNGTIANDKELADEYKLHLYSKIDTAVIPALLHAKGATSLEEAQRIIENEVIGSYAFAIMDAQDPSGILLMCNYKPIYIAYNFEHKYYAFASQPEMLVASPLEMCEKWAINKMPAYSSVTIGSEGLRHRGFHPCKYLKHNKALVVCSGGLDSTVAATIARQDYNEIKLIHFLYGCKAQAKEKQTIMNIASKLDCDYEFISTDFWTAYAKGSNLTSLNTKIAKNEHGAELAHEWVYARNTVFLSMAVAYAEAHGYDDIILGNNLEESSAFSDNEPEFIRKFNEMLPNVTNLNTHIQIIEPVGNLMKHEIVKLGLSIGAPIEETWSCYSGNEVPCNDCGPCFNKKKAFEMNGYVLSENQRTWLKKG